MSAHLANIVYGSTKLTSIIDWLVDAIFWIIKEILAKVFEPVLVLIYDVLIWLPLQVINAMNTLFHFFAAGFADKIFGGTVNPNGSISYSFSFTSGLGQIMTFALILSLVMFFMYFIIAFATGSRGYGANRAKEFKWPVIMFIVFLVTPPVLILADSLMGALLNGLSGGSPKLLSGTDVSNLKTYAFSDFDKLSKVTTTVTALINLNSLNDSITRALKVISDNQGGDDNFGPVKVYLQYTQTDIQYICDYLNTGGNAVGATIGSDMASFKNMVDGWNPGPGGMYISDDNANTLTTISNNLQNLQTNFLDLITENTALLSDDCTVGWASIAKYDSTVQSEIMTPLSDIVSSLGKSGSVNDLGYFFSDNDSSITNLLISSSSKYPSLSDLPWYRNVSPPFSVVEVLYTTITGDTNANNWSVMPKIGWGNRVIQNMNIFQFFIGGFACWSMILIMWSFCQSAIKRTYYIVGYWIVGFLYIANGASNPNGVPTWYKMVFGKWIGVLVMFMMYMMVGVILNLITPAIQSGLANMKFGDIKVLVLLGIVFSIEAAYQTAYQLSQTYMGEWGAKDETFSAQNPLSFLQQGSALLSSVKNTAVHYATGGPIKEAYKEAKSVPDYWKKRKLDKMGNLNTQKQYAEFKGKKDSSRGDAAKSGYDFSDRAALSPSGKLYDIPKKEEAAPAAGAPGAGAAPAAGGGGAAPAAEADARPAPAPNPNADFVGKVRVRDGVVPSDWKTNVTPGKRILGGMIPVNKGFQRIGNLAGGTAVNVAHKVLEAGHNAAAYVLRKTGIAGLVCGAAGIIGGERGTTAVKWALGSSKKRMTHAEKEWAIANNKIVKKDAKTGDLHVYEPGIVPVLNVQANRKANTARGDSAGNQWYLPGGGGGPAGPAPVAEGGGDIGLPADDHAGVAPVADVLAPPVLPADRPAVEPLANFDYIDGDERGEAYRGGDGE